jgi:hypothetical protein
MAIEGNDWWALAGAAASGVAAGLIGAKLIKSGKEDDDPVFTGIRRWYEEPSTEDVRNRSVATIWKKNGGYRLRVYALNMPTGASLRDEAHVFNMIGEGIAPEFEERFESMEAAMKFADQGDWPPITDWGYPSEKVKVLIQSTRIPNAMNRSEKSTTSGRSTVSGRRACGPSDLPRSRS